MVLCSQSQLITIFREAHFVHLCNGILIKLHVRLSFTVNLFTIFILYFFFSFHFISLHCISTVTHFYIYYLFTHYDLRFILFTYYYFLYLFLLQYTHQLEPELQMQYACQPRFIFIHLLFCFDA